MFLQGKYEKLGYAIFNKLPNYQKKYKSLINRYEISFLLGLINDYKFSDGREIETVLEVGVFNGVTSLYILKEGIKKPKFELYGIDLGKTDFFGEAIFKEAKSNELEHYHLHRKSTSFDIEHILNNNKINMVFIDAGHSHPHPLFDLIHVIPFLHKESIVILHDVVLYMRPNA